MVTWSQFLTQHLDEEEEEEQAQQPMEAAYGLIAEEEMPVQEESEEAEEEEAPDVDMLAEGDAWPVEQQPIAAVGSDGTEWSGPDLPCPNEVGCCYWPHDWYSRETEAAKEGVAEATAAAFDALRFCQPCTPTMSKYQGRHHSSRR